MKYEMWKRAGGKFEPASDMVEEKLKKLKNDEMYEVEIKRVKNPRFHRKMFVFFHYCFEYWNGEGAFFSEPAQFDYFRKELVKAAGFVDTYYSLTGEVRSRLNRLLLATWSLRNSKSATTRLSKPLSLRFSKTATPKRYTTS